MPTPLDAIAGVPNAAAPLPNLVTGGQPTAHHFEALALAGVKTVLDIRHPSEPRPFDEPTLLGQLGLEYVNIPVTADSLTEATLEKILELVRAKAGEPFLFHCASGNRVGGALIPHFMLDHGMTEEQALQAAMRVGLRGADVAQWGLEYVRRRQG